MSAGARANAAREALLRFARSRGQAAVRLAMHAAVPQTFRPDLVHLLRINFVPEAEQAGSAAESDVLLASFCTPLGGDFFRFDPETRRQLVDHLAVTYVHERPTRQRRVAAMVLAYLERAERRTAGQGLLFSDYLQVERWVAAAFYAPQETATQFARELAGASASGAGACLQLGGLAPAMELPLGRFPHLLAYARALAAIEEGDQARAQVLLDALPATAIEVGGVKLASLRQWVGGRPGAAGAPTATATATASAEAGEQRPPRFGVPGGDDTHMTSPVRSAVDQVIARLLAGVRLVYLLGRRSSGKSAAAAAVARSPLIDRKFPGGVMWLPGEKSSVVVAKLSSFSSDPRPILFVLEDASIDTLDQLRGLPGGNFAVVATSQSLPRELGSDVAVVRVNAPAGFATEVTVFHQWRLKPGAICIVTAILHDEDPDLLPVPAGLAEDYHTETKDLLAAIPPASDVEFTLQFPDLGVFRTTKARFEATLLRYEMELSVNDVPSAPSAGTLSVLFNGARVAVVPLQLTVVEADRADVDRASPDGPDLLVFPCYDDLDGAIVQQFQNMAGQLGRRYVAVAKRHPDPRLTGYERERISRADVFELFWSSRAAKSQRVINQVDYALKLKRKDFIRPIYWETLLPTVPEELAELQSLDFVKIELPLAQARGNRRRKVFITSTLTELQEYRSAARAAISTFQSLDSAGVEDLAKDLRFAEAAVLEAARRCDVFVLIIGHRFGFVSSIERTPVFDEACDQAREMGKPVFAFVVDAHGADVKPDPAMQAFRDRLRKTLVLYAVSTPKELEAGLHAALTHYLQNAPHQGSS